METPRVILRVDGEGQYSGADPVSGLEFRADYLRRDSRSGELGGELSVAGGGEDGVLSVGSFNFSSVSARSHRAKLIKERASGKAGKVDVLGHLEAFCQYIAQQERSGQPAIVLRSATSRPPQESTFQVLGLEYPLEHLGITFGAGGTMKSYLKLLVASELAKMGKRVLYSDWELGAADHRYRLECINGREMPDTLWYCRCTRPLIHEVDRLRRIGKAERIDYHFLDSVGYGTAGDPAAADAAMDYCRAAGQLGAGVGAIAHITKNGESNDQMPYGSVFWHNSARCTYNLKLSAESDDGRTLMLGAFQRKSNLTRRRPPIGIQVTFDGDRVYFRNSDIGAVDDFAASLPLWQRMVSVLKAGPQTLATIGSELGHENVESLDRIVRKHKTLFQKVPGSDGIMRIALVERRAL